jgi:hypothetical protein
MAIPTLITELSTTAATNAPSGSDSPSSLDDIQRAHGAFIAQLRDDPTANATTVTPVAKGGTGAATAAAARTALGVAPRATRIDVASVAGTVDLTTNAPNTDDIRLTGALTITGFTVAVGRVFRVTAGGAFTLTNGASIVTQTGANIVAASGDTFMLRATAANVVEVLSYSAATVSTSVLRSYIAGLKLSTAGSSATMSIAAGQAADSTNAVLMSLASAISKTTSAWAVGTAAGGLDTGTIANSTWYYFYLIRRPDTGVVDVVFSTSSSAPTLPTNYTQYRYIGGGITNGSAQWVKFTQVGDEFWWDTPVLDAARTASATATLETISVPRGRKVQSIMSATMSSSTTGGSYFSDPDNADLAPSVTAAPLMTFGYSSIASVLPAASFRVWTNTSAQIRHREPSASGGIYITTLGWVDLRGKDL